MHKFQYNDGGRSLTFDTRGVNDCVTRSFALLTGRPYREIWDHLHALKLVGRTGMVATYQQSFQDYANDIGLMYVSCEKPMKDVSFPPRAVVCIRQHYFALIDGVMHDECNHSKSGRTIVQGIWVAKPQVYTMYNVVSAATGLPLNRAPLNHSQAETMARLMLLNYKTQTNIKPI